MSDTKGINKTQIRPRRKMQRVSGNGNSSRRGPARQMSPFPPMSNFEEVVQRLADLYDFAPIGYVSFDRTGRIAEVNLAAAKLLGRSRDLLIGRPFPLFVVRQDTQLFFDHLLRCRSSERQVESELRLKDVHGEIVFAHLSSTPTVSTLRDGTLLYKTAI